MLDIEPLGEPETLNPNTEVLNNIEVPIENIETGGEGLESGNEITIQLVDIPEVDITEPELVDILPLATTTEATINPEPISSTKLDPTATSTDETLLTPDTDTSEALITSVEDPEPDIAPVGSDTATYYIDKYYQKTYNGSGTNYYFLGNIKLATENLGGSTAGIFYSLSDHLGSSSLITSTDGSITEVSDYRPYGSIAYENVTTNTGNAYKYTGKEADTENGLQYFGARYYQNTIGRFMSIDPYSFQLDKLVKLLSDPQQFNGYSYTRNNPIILVDPDGRIARDHWFMQLGRGVDTAFKTIGSRIPITSSIFAIYGSEGSWASNIQKGLDEAAAAPTFRDSMRAYSDNPEFQAMVMGTTLPAPEGIGYKAVGGIVQKSGSQIYSRLGDLSSRPIVKGAINKLEKVADEVGQTSAEILKKASTEGIGLIDNLNNGNINVIFQKSSDMAAGFVRVTLNPAAEKIISAGTMRFNQVWNGIVSGRFNPF